MHTLNQPRLTDLLTCTNTVRKLLRRPPSQTNMRDFTFRNARLTVTEELRRADTEKRLARVSASCASAPAPTAGEAGSLPARSIPGSTSSTWPRPPR